MSLKNLVPVGALALAALVAACSETSSPVGDNLGQPMFATTAAPDTGEFEICKYGTSASFTWTLNGGATQNVTLADGECAILGTGKGQNTVVVSEDADATIVLDSFVVSTVTIFNPVPVRGAPVTGPNSFTGTFNGDRGTLVEWYNSPAPPPDEGCTFTLGYWKNHLAAWPAPFTPGATFYTSGKTWIQVLNTSPLGNAYFILAKQFIAATLNGASGASAPANVAQALVDADAYFQDPAGSSLTRAQLIAMATLLDDYNNGVTGPGHCP